MLALLASACLILSCQSSGESQQGYNRMAAGGPGGQGPGGQGGFGQGTPPSGPPPDGMMQQGGSGSQQQGGPGQGPGGQPQKQQKKGPSSYAGAYTLRGGTATIADRTCTADRTDTSGIVVSDGGILVARAVTVATTGKASFLENSSSCGLDAGVLAVGGSTIVLDGSAVATRGAGANGVFATGEGSSVIMRGGTITATGTGAHAVMATLGGTLTARDVDMTTAGESSGAIATDRGGGTIIVSGGTVATSGHDSPGIYSTGTIAVSGAKVAATGAEAAVIEGANSIVLEGTNLSSTFPGKWGVMIYQSMSGDAAGKQGHFAMTGGRLAYTAQDGPLFYVTNSTGAIALSDVAVEAPSGILVRAGAGRWGASGANGGNAVLACDAQTIAGDLVADSLSTLTVSLANHSAWTGAINAAGPQGAGAGVAGPAKSAAVTLDASSTWSVTADSTVTTLTEPAGVTGDAIANIASNGHTVRYRASANPWLAGKTWALPGGGSLAPY